MQFARSQKPRCRYRFEVDLLHLFRSTVARLLSRGLSYATAEEVAQMALSELTRTGFDWSETSDELARRFRIRVKSRLVDHFRRTIRERERCNDPRATAVGTTITPPDAAARTEARARTQKLFDGMPLQLRDLAAVWLDGRSEASVAEALHVSRGELRCLKARLHRALRNRATELSMNMSTLLEAL